MEKKEKPIAKKCICGREAITVKTGYGKMLSCPNPEKCNANLRTAWHKKEETAITEWNTLVYQAKAAGKCERRKE